MAAHDHVGSLGPARERPGGCRKKNCWRHSNAKISRPATASSRLSRRAARRFRRTVLASVDDRRMGPSRPHAAGRCRPLWHPRHVNACACDAYTRPGIARYNCSAAMTIRPYERPLESTEEAIIRPARACPPDTARLKRDALADYRDLSPSRDRRVTAM